MTRLQLSRACKAAPTLTKPTQPKVRATPFALDIPGCIPSAFPDKTVYVCASRFRTPDCDFTIKPW